MGGVSRDGKETSLAGLTAGAWLGEGSVLKNEPRRYDVVALRDSRVALMERSAFMWLFENSVGFNRCLVPAQRTARPVHRYARGNRTLDPMPACPQHRLPVQSDPLSGVHRASGNHPGGDRCALRHVRQNANRALNRLEKEGLLRLEYGGVTILDVERLRGYGD